MMPYDLIIVGAGLYGATAARAAHDRGERVLVLEKRDEVAGNCCDEPMDGIMVHKYGAHIFHTSSEEVWSFVNRFAQFAHYEHRVRARNGGREYSLPFNLSTIEQVYGLRGLTAEMAEEILQEERRREFYPMPDNLKQQAVNLVGRRIYECLVKGYTEKQWGRPASELSAEIISRLPVRMNHDDRYFSDMHQGLPIGGYTQMVKRMLHGVEVRTGVDFLAEKEFWMRQAPSVLYTGMVDELLCYTLGPLPYRSLRFEIVRLTEERFQSLPVINDTSPDTPFTRTIEHKLFPGASPLGQSAVSTIVTYEYPAPWQPGREAFYPVNNARSEHLYQEYTRLLARRHPNIRLGGRLGLYRYLDMDQTIAHALKNWR